MKSQEYFEKYFANESNPAVLEKNCKAMLLDFLKEYDVLKKQRNMKTVDGLVGIVRELNEKWNAVAGRVERKFSVKLIKRNVLWNELLSNGDELRFPRRPD